MKKRRIKKIMLLALAHDGGSVASLECHSEILDQM